MFNQEYIVYNVCNVYVGVDFIMVVNNGINIYFGFNDVWDGGEEVFDDIFVQVSFIFDFVVF